MSQIKNTSAIDVEIFDLGLLNHYVLGLPLPAGVTRAAVARRIRKDREVAEVVQDMNKDLAPLLDLTQGWLGYKGAILDARNNGHVATDDRLQGAWVQHKARSKDVARRVETAETVVAFLSSLKTTRPLAFAACCLLFFVTGRQTAFQAVVSPAPVNVPNLHQGGSKDFPVTGSKDFPVTGSKDFPVTGSKDFPVTGSKDFPVSGSKDFPVSGSKDFPVKGSKPVLHHTRSTDAGWMNTGDSLVELLNPVDKTLANAIVLWEQAQLQNESDRAVRVKLLELYARVLRTPVSRTGLDSSDLARYATKQAATKKWLRSHPAPAPTP